MRIGLDIGSTTIKAVVLGDGGEILYKNYRRHYSLINEKAVELLKDICEKLPRARESRLAISGSAGMGLERCGLPFVQEVYATRVAVEYISPDTDVVIELGGEDAKILFLSGLPDTRMNGSCAGGTGAFIDQMATLLGVDLQRLNELAESSEKQYTIASRCGVFAKSDIQSLLNQGARDNDIAASIFSAVVNQTITGLAQGRPIEGDVLYLGGPLSFLSGLRSSFDSALKLHGTCPDNSQYYVAIGAALSASVSMRLDDTIQAISRDENHDFASMPPLFTGQDEYEAFAERHRRCKVARSDNYDYASGVYIGIDAGSTTVKFAVTGSGGELLQSCYKGNSGNPVPLIRGFLSDMYSDHSDVCIKGSAVTGYGEDLIKSAFRLDHGIVETMAHLTAAQRLQPDVDFILDIGGQDMKCMKIHNGVIDKIYLNEACSSGCGSFLQTFANALGEDIGDFSKLGLFAGRPVDLGSRCTVFMNSSVKQAQKDGASMEDISAGLSVSVVKNALYKVIRPASLDDLGNHIVVQGGTFHNDAVLRAFEQEIGQHVSRPDIAGTMGAYGAALYAMEHSSGSSTTVTAGQLALFQHRVKVTNCGLCPNNCMLTINNFGEGRKYISGNRCQRPLTRQKQDNSLNIYNTKLELLEEYKQVKGGRPIIGIPMGLNTYELLPFWRAMFDSLGYDVVTGGVSDRDVYLRGQGSIPSDTVCYPAKLVHGHIQQLIDDGVDTIFYPCMTYNVDEGRADNCFNCPIVAYYPEVIKSNMKDIDDITFMTGYIGLHRPKDTPAKMHKLLSQYLSVNKSAVKSAVKAGYDAYNVYTQDIRKAGQRIIAQARTEGKPIVVLAGRPYHIDPGINHGIDGIAISLGAAVVSEDALMPETNGNQSGGSKLPLDILNQWTFHNRLYDAAYHVVGQQDMLFVQLVSFGCGCDAVTTDECRSILEDNGHIYSQIKIDEIENLGAARIRLRSLFAAVGADVNTNDGTNTDDDHVYNAAGE